MAERLQMFSRAMSSACTLYISIMRSCLYKKHNPFFGLLQMFYFDIIWRPLCCKVYDVISGAGLWIFLRIVKMQILVKKHIFVKFISPRVCGCVCVKVIIKSCWTTNYSHIQINEQPKDTLTNTLWTTINTK